MSQDKEYSFPKILQVIEPKAKITRIYHFEEDGRTVIYREPVLFLALVEHEDGDTALEPLSLLDGNYWEGVPYTGESNLLGTEVAELNGPRDDAFWLKQIRPKNPKNL